MFKVTDSTGKEYYVTFKYDRENRETCVSIYDKEPSKDSIYNTAGLFWDKATCSVKDNFDRNKGRKIALMRVLKNFPKSERIAFWLAYTAHHKDKKLAINLYRQITNKGI